MLNKKILLLLIFILFAQIMQAQLKPTNEVTFFWGNQINSGYGERDMAITPDGKEMYYTIMGLNNTFSAIVFRTKTKEGKWSQPEIVSFSGQYHDLEPALSRDGKKLFFSSNRPLQGTKSKDYDIWVVDRTTTGWSSPVNIGSPVNTNEDEFYPSIANNGNLYFTAQRENGIGKEDIFMSRFDNGIYQTPVVLDTMVNSKKWEFNAFVAPDENYILFTSYGQADDIGGGDLYICLKDLNGKWTAAQNLRILNSTKLDYCPYVTTDGETLIFTSPRHTIPENFTIPQSYKALNAILQSADNGTDNLYWINFKKLLDSLR